MTNGMARTRERTGPGEASEGGRGRSRRPRPAFLCIGLGACLAIGAGEAAGQSAREGQWLGVGLGGGVDQVACSVCAGDARPGIAGHLRFGGTLSSRLLVGGEFALWTRSDDGVRQFLAALSAVGLLYGGPDARFHLEFGAGAVGFRASEEGDELTALSVGVTGGVGYDVPLSPTLSLTPFASLTLAPFADLHFNGDLSVGGATLGLLQAGVGLTWH